MVRLFSVGFDLFLCAMFWLVVRFVCLVTWLFVCGCFVAICFCLLGDVFVCFLICLMFVFVVWLRGYCTLDFSCLWMCWFVLGMIGCVCVISFLWFRVIWWFYWLFCLICLDSGWVCLLWFWWCVLVGWLFVCVLLVFSLVCCDLLFDVVGLLVSLLLLVGFVFICVGFWFCTVFFGCFCFCVFFV